MSHLILSPAPAPSPTQSAPAPCGKAASAGGVCYEVYRIGERPGDSFIFQGGGYDSFSEEDLGNWLELTDEVAPPVVDFKFKNFMPLSGAYDAGRFDEALKRVSA